MRHSRAGWAAAAWAAVLMLGGCAPAVESAMFGAGPAEARTAPAAIRVYENTVPVCAFVELGTVRGRMSGWKSLDRVLRRMRERAAQLGGDAILDLREIEQGLAGSVIRFTRDCDPDDVRPRQQAPGAE